MEESKDLLRKLKPLLGSQTRGLWQLMLMPGDAETALKNKELLRVLSDQRAKVDYSEPIRLPPPSPNKLKGRYGLGDVLYPDEVYGSFGLEEGDFIKHILITGMTGTGKTNLCFHLLRQLVKEGKPFLVLDWKRNYRQLKQLPEFKDLEIISIGSKNSTFRFNPLIPPDGIDPKHWLALLVDVIKHAFFVGHGVEYFFRKGIDQLYRKFLIYEGNQVYPTMADLEKLMVKEYVKGREMLWMASVKRVLASLTFSGLLGETLNVRKQPKLEDLLKKNVIIEMDNLATIEKVFLVESLLLWIYQFRKGEPEKEKFKHAILIEEAHHILSEAKENKMGEEPITETIVRMIREFGESIIAVDQEPSKISRSIIANTNCKICFNLGSGYDMETMGKAMNLKQEEQRFIDKLKVGQAIGKMKSRFSEPVHLRFPLVPINKSKPTDS